MTVMKTFVVLSAVLFSCPSHAAAQDLTPVTLGMNFAINGQFLPLIAAKQWGYYEEEGLDVSIQEGKSSSVAAQLVATGQLDFAYGDGPTGMQVAARGAPVTSVLTVFATNPFVITSLARNPIETAEEIAGKRIGVSAGGAQMALIPHIDALNGLEGAYELLPMDGSAQYAALLQGQVDGIHVAADKAVALKEQGADVRQLYLRDIGAPTVGPGIMVNNVDLGERPEIVKAFLAATIRGLSETMADPSAAAAAAVALYPDLDARLLVEQFAAVSPFVCAENSTHMGRANEANWLLAQQLLSAAGSVPADANLSVFVNYDYLPEDLPVCMP